MCFQISFQPYISDSVYIYLLQLSNHNDYSPSNLIITRLTHYDLPICTQQFLRKVSLVF